MLKIDYSVKNSRNGEKYDIVFDRGNRSGPIEIQELFMFFRNSLIQIADAALRDEQSRGFTKTPIVVVDGSTSKSVANVDTFGKIMFTTSAPVLGYMSELYNMILSRSPVDTGFYKEGNVVMWNGRIVAMTMDELKSWIKSKPDIQTGDVIRYLNVTPYARKLERYGITSTARSKPKRWVKSRDKKKRSGEKILAPNGVYFLALKAITRKYKFTSQFKFEFIPGSSLGIEIPSQGPNGTLRTRYVKDGRTYLYPSIKIIVGRS